MKVLVTGFDPFGGESINPSYEAVKQLPETIAGAEIIKMEIPTSFKRSMEVLEEAIRLHRPDMILSVGQAGGRNSISVEKVAINYAHARIADNDGAQPLDQALKEDGDTAYFGTLPLLKMVDKMNEAGIAAALSFSAGTFVCNSVMYSTRYLIEKKYPGIKSGFIHVPFIEEQTAGKAEGTPFMTLEQVTKGLAAAIESCII